MNEEIARLFLAKFFERVGPKDIAHESMGWRLAETINLFICQFPANATPEGRYVRP
jgi:hypothetical protein